MAGFSLSFSCIAQAHGKQITGLFYMFQCETWCFLQVKGPYLQRIYHKNTMLKSLKNNPGGLFKSSYVFYLTILHKIPYRDFPAQSMLFTCT